MECVPGKLAAGKISPQSSTRECEKIDMEESRSCGNIFIFLTQHFPCLHYNNAPSGLDANEAHFSYSERSETSFKACKTN